MILSLGPPIAALSSSLILLGVDATFWIVFVFSCIFLFFLLGVRIYLKRVLPKRQQGTIAFFHPSANGGGGGERVLWCGIKSVQEAYPKAKVVIFSAEGLSGDALRRNAVQKFNISIPHEVEVVHLSNRNLIAAESYTSFTLVGQNIGSVKMVFSALLQLRPQVFVDTTGWAFMYPLVRLAGVKVASYTHYPTISTSMLQRVATKTSMYNNSGWASTLPGAALKLVYYYIFACFYGMAGGCANVVMVNSSWTRKHIRQLWWKLEDTKRVFPPCNTVALQALPLERKLKRLYLVSVAQFRPEKDHRLQLRAFALARQWASQSPSTSSSPVLAARLKLIGSCRGPADAARIDALHRECEELGLQDMVDFCINVSFEELRQLLADAVGGIHTMLDEHFGISIVEYMAAGVIPIAHNSGGPKEDIVTPPGSSAEATGFLCDSLEQYAQAITQVLCMEPQDRRPIAAAARRKAEQFSDAAFEMNFLQALQRLLLMLEVG